MGEPNDMHFTSLCHVFLTFFAYKVTSWKNMEVTAENEVWFGGHCMSTSSDECKKRQ